MALSLDKFLIGTFVFLLFIYGGVLLVHEVEISYDDEGVDMELDQYINETYFTLNDKRPELTSEAGQLGNTSYDLSKDTQDRMLGKELDTEDTESSMFSGAFSVFRLVPTSIGLVGKVMEQVAGVMGIDPVFIQIAFSVLVILVIFGIILLIFRVRS